MLSSVNDGLQIGLSGVSELSLPELTYVGGDMLLSNNKDLEHLELKELVNIQGSLEIVHNDNLQDVALPYLSSIGEDLNMTGAFERCVPSNNLRRRPLSY